MFWITENHFLFVGLFDWENAYTQTFSVSQNGDSFAFAEFRTRKCSTIAPLIPSIFNVDLRMHLFNSKLVFCSIKCDGTAKL